MESGSKTGTHPFRRAPPMYFRWVNAASRVWRSHEMAGVWLKIARVWATTGARGAIYTLTLKLVADPGEISVYCCWPWLRLLYTPSAARADVRAFRSLTYIHLYKVCIRWGSIRTKFCSLKIRKQIICVGTCVSVEQRPFVSNQTIPMSVNDNLVISLGSYIFSSKI